MRLKRYAGLFCAALILPAAGARAVSFGTGFSQMTLQNVVPGETYNTREIFNLPYMVTNKSKEPIVGSVAVTIPIKAMLKKGYEPIPDAGWLSLSDNSLYIEPGQAKAIDIILRVPDEDRYYNRKYQAGIEAAARVTGGNLAGAVVTKVVFTTVRSRDFLKNKKIEKKILANLNYQVLPPKFILKGLKPGVEYDISKVYGRSYKIVNMNDASYDYELSCVPAEDEMQSVAADYTDSSGSGWLKFGKKKLTMPPNTIKTVKITLKIPDKEENYGRKFQFNIKTTLLGQEIPVAVFNFVYAETLKKSEIRE